MHAPEVTDVVDCELCCLPHRRGAVFCDGCAHRLGTTPDWDVVRRDLFRLRLQLGVAGCTVAVLVVANLFALQRGGYFLWLVPFAWLGFAALRHRTLTRRLRAAGRRD